MTDVPPGDYALVVHHDENGNRRIDRNFVGIPREPLGFSNGYQPRGPPVFGRASFVLQAGASRHFEIMLRRPLGRRGRIGAGVGVLARGSPYRGAGGATVRFIPALTYTGDRLQVFGPNLRIGIAGSERFRAALSGTYRVGSYEEDDSRVLRGMGDREDTFMCGLALRSELPGGLELSAGYEHDALDRIGGGAARLAAETSFSVGVLRLSPEAALNWLSPELARHEFGVPSDRAALQRPAYRPGGAFSFEVGIGFLADIGRHWLIVGRLALERLDDEATDSPLVDTDYVLSGFAAFNRVF
jgi:outer membrane protein